MRMLDGSGALRNAGLGRGDGQPDLKVLDMRRVVPKMLVQRGCTS